MRRAIAAALLLVAALGACAGPGLLNPSPSPSSGAAAVPTPRRTQNVPSRAPLPSVQPFPTFADPPTFPPSSFATPNPTRPPDPALLAMIPATIDGHELQRLSGRASDFGENGDMCFAFCPGELQQTARNAGADPDDVTWAVGYLQSGTTGILVRAMRVPKASSDLFRAWFVDAPFVLFYSTTDITIVGRHATLLRSPSTDNPEAIYAIVSGNVLMLVQEAPAAADPTRPSSNVLEAFSKLP